MAFDCAGTAVDFDHLGNRINWFRQKAVNPVRKVADLGAVSRLNGVRGTCISQKHLLLDDRRIDDGQKSQAIWPVQPGLASDDFKEAQMQVL